MSGGEGGEKLSGMAKIFNGTTTAGRANVMILLYKNLML